MSYSQPFFIPMEKTMQEIYMKVVNDYKKDKNILGIILFGSVVRNVSDRRSDVDIYILLKEKGDYSRINFVQNTVRVDIILDTIKETEAYLKKDEFNFRRNTSHMLAHGKILYQTTTDAEKMIRKAKKNLMLPTKYTENEILMHKYSIDDFWNAVQRDIENENIVAFGFDSQLLLNNIIELFLKLHGKFLRQPNEMKDVFEKLDKTFAQNIQSFYTANDLKTKQKVLAELVSYSYKQSKGELPQTWFIKN